MRTPTPRSSRKKPTPRKNLTPFKKGQGVSKLRFSSEPETPTMKPPLMKPPIKRPTPAKTEPAPTQATDGGEEGIVVAIRMRPLNSKETTSESSSSSTASRVWKVLPQYTSIAQTTPDGKPLAENVSGRNFFTYDKTFGEDTSTRDVYNGAVKNIVQGVVAGLNGTVFAYGQTSSGKTYTMQGSGSIEEGNVTGGGVVHMATKDIFAHIANTPDRMFLVRTSFIEIYNEEVRDLLSRNEVLQIREDPQKGVFVSSAEEIVTDFNSLLQVLFSGEKNRAVAATGMNDRSSRSHTIFRITIESRQKTGEDDDDSSKEPLDTEGQNDVDGAVRISTLNLVDLAGSESVRHTGSTGERQKEGGKINQSLLTLSRVIVALGQPNKPHVNFRDSKLTRILQPSLSGNARMAIICCATPSELYLEETRSTLLFASRAKLVTTNAKVNEVLDDRSLIKRLQRELAEARKHGGGPNPEHLRALKMEAATAGTAAREAEEKLQRLKASLLNNNALFVKSYDTDCVMSEAPIIKGRKRRISDGDLIPHDSLLMSPPSQLIRRADGSAVTRPRSESRVIGREKMARNDHRPLSPSSELSLLREAFTAKSDHVRKLEGKLEASENVVAATKSELSDAYSEAEKLRVDRDVSKEKCNSLKERISVLSTEHGVLVSEKDAAIREAFDRLEKELAERAEMKESLLELKERFDAVSADNATLSSRCLKVEDEKEQLQLRFDRVSEERVRGAFELAQANSEKDKFVKEREEDKGRLQLMTATMQEAVSEKDEALERIEVLLQEIIVLKDEKSVATTEVGALQEALSKHTSDVQALQKAVNELNDETKLLKIELKGSESKVSEMTADAVSKNEAISQLQQQLGEMVKENAARESNFEKATEKIVAEKEALQTKVINLNGVVESLSTEKSEYASRQIELAAECEAQRTALNDTTSTNTDLKKRLESIQIERDGFVTQVRELETLLARTNEEKTATEEELLQVADEHDAARATLSGLESMKKEMETKVSQLLVELDALRIQMATEESKNIELHERNVEITRECDGAVAEIENKKVAHEEALQKIVQLEANVDTLKIKVEDFQENIQALTREKDSICEKLAIVQSEKGTLENESKTKEEKIEELIAEKDTLERNMVDRESIISNLSAQVKETTLALSGAERKLQVAEETSQLLRSTIADMESAQASHEQELQFLSNARDGVSEEVGKLQTEKDDIETKLEQATLQVQNLSTEKESAEKELGESQSALSHLKQEHDATKASLNETRGELDKVKADYASLQAAAETLKSSKNELEVQLEEAFIANNATQGQLECLKVEKKNVEAELDKAAARVDAFSSEKDSFAREMEERNSRIAHLQEEKAALSVSFVKAKNDTEISKEKLAGLQATIVQMQSNKEEIECSLQAVSSARDGVVGQLEEIKEENNSLVEKLQELESSYSNLEVERDEALHTAKQLIINIEEMSGAVEKANCKYADVSSRLKAAENKVKTLEEANRTLQDELRSTNNGEESLDSLKKKLDETTLLLSDANEQVYTAREDAASKDEELELMNLKLEEKLLLLHESNGKIAELERRVTSSTNSREHNEEVQLLLDEKTYLEDELRKERADRKESEEKLKCQMGDEQRALIQAGEVELSKLRDEINCLKTDCAEAEANAYSARQEVEELHDQNNRIELVASESEQKITMLKNEIVRAREVETSLRREFASELASPLLSSAAGSDLSDILINAMRMKMKNVTEKQMKAEKECRQAKEKILEVKADSNHLMCQLEDTKSSLKNKERLYDEEMNEAKEKLRRSQEEHYAARQELLSLKDELSEVNRDRAESNQEVATLQEMVSTLEATVSSLNKDAESAARNNENITESKLVAELRQQVKTMDKELKSKDNRIQKLEKVRLTKEQCEALKKMKTERSQFMKEAEENKAKLEEAKTEITQLKLMSSNHGGTRGAVSGDDEFSEMKFAKQALETKLRKYAAHCQRLEGEKASIVDALVSCNRGSIQDGDFAGAVVNLCDKLSSLEEELEALGNAEGRASSYLMELDGLRVDNEELRNTNSRAHDHVSRLTKSESDLQKKLRDANELVALLRVDNNKLKLKVESEKTNAENLENEKSQQLHALEGDILRLTLEVQQTKKQLRNAKADLNLYEGKMNAPDVDTDTFDPLVSRTNLNVKEKRDLTPLTPDGKENRRNSRSHRGPLSAIKDSANKRQVTSSARSSKKKGKFTPGRKTVGLGEVGEPNEENTQECKQS